MWERLRWRLQVTWRLTSFSGMAKHNFLAFGGCMVGHGPPTLQPVFCQASPRMRRRIPQARQLIQPNWGQLNLNANFWNLNPLLKCLICFWVPGAWVRLFGTLVKTLWTQQTIPANVAACCGGISGDFFRWFALGGFLYGPYAWEFIWCSLSEPEICPRQVARCDAPR